METKIVTFRSNDVQRWSISQPDPTMEHNECRLEHNGPNNNNDLHNREGNTIAWSQPSNINDMLLSQIVTTPGSSSQVKCSSSSVLISFCICQWSLTSLERSTYVILKDTFGQILTHVLSKSFKFEWRLYGVIIQSVFEKLRCSCWALIFILHRATIHSSGWSNVWPGSTFHSPWMKLKRKSWPSSKCRRIVKSQLPIRTR